MCLIKYHLCTIINKLLNTYRTVARVEYFSFEFYGINIMSTNN